MNRTIRYLILTAAIVFTLPTLGTAQEPIEDSFDTQLQNNVPNEPESLDASRRHHRLTWGAYHAGRGGIQFIHGRRGRATYAWNGEYRNVGLRLDSHTFDREYLQFKETDHSGHRWAIPRRAIHGCYHIWFRPAYSSRWIMVNVTNRALLDHRFPFRSRKANANKN